VAGRQLQMISRRRLSCPTQVPDLLPDLLG
jgi:hypothetical protein